MGVIVACWAVVAGSLIFGIKGVIVVIIRGSGQTEAGGEVGKGGEEGATVRVGFDYAGGGGMAAWVGGRVAWGARGRAGEWERWNVGFGDLGRLL
jgi:hypothetical protein